VLALVVGWALAALALVLDRVTGLVLPVELAGARAILGSLTGAILTIAVFAVWMRTVVVGLAAAHVSPRVVSSYLDDDFQRRMTGWMVAGFGYVLGVLAFLPGTPDGDDHGIAAISTVLAVVVVVVALVAILFAIRHAVASLSLSALVRALADRCFEAMRVPDRPDDEVPADLPNAGAVHTVTSDAMGWIQAVDYPRILEVLPRGTVLTLRSSIGEFVAPTDAVAVASRELDAEADHVILSALTVESTRRSELDVAFAIQQLVDVAQHATTPSSNDTSTADEALVHIRAVMQELLRNGKFSGCLAGSDGRAVVTPAIWDPAHHLEVAFERLRAGAARMPVTFDRLLDTMDALTATAREVGDESSLAVLARQRSLLTRAAAGTDAEPGSSTGSTVG
jgi:uncharacterized membrane protein